MKTVLEDEITQCNKWKNSVAGLNKQIDSVTKALRREFHPAMDGRSFLRRREETDTTGLYII